MKILQHGLILKMLSYDAWLNATINIQSLFYASYLQLQNGIIVKINVRNALGQVFKPKLQIEPFNFESNLSSTLIKTSGLFGPVATLANKLVLNPNFVGVDNQRCNDVTCLYSKPKL